MKYGVLADIHGNLPALEAAIRLGEREGVDRFVCLGDLVGYGPFPNECVARVQELGAACVAGNHDLMALDRLPDDRCVRLARVTMKWTRTALGDAARAYLEKLPERLTLPGGIVLAHGSLDDPREYITRPEQAKAQLDRLRELEPEARILLLGHTHRPLAVSAVGGMICPRTDQWLKLDSFTSVLLNPGAVGQSREWRALARCLILDPERHVACFRAVEYPVQEVRDALRFQELPPNACHVRPSPLRDAARALRRRLRPKGTPRDADARSRELHAGAR
jgi:predicted phosphodiesterase